MLIYTMLYISDAESVWFQDWLLNHEESLIYEWGAYVTGNHVSTTHILGIVSSNGHLNQSLSWGDEVLEDELERHAAPEHRGAIPQAVPAAI